MQAHGADLREEVKRENGGGGDRDEVLDEVRGEALVQAVMSDYREADLSAADRAMLDYAVKLTRTPERMDPADVEALREHRFSDDAISEIVQIAAMFNYYNRLADGLGIDNEPGWPAPGHHRSHGSA